MEILNAKMGWWITSAPFISVALSHTLTATQKLSAYYPGELFLGTQLSKTGGPDAKLACSLVQGLCNADETMY